jgi:hypothetical protein
MKGKGAGVIIGTIPEFMAEKYIKISGYSMSYPRLELWVHRIEVRSVTT